MELDETIPEEGEKPETEGLEDVEPGRSPILGSLAMLNRRRKSIPSPAKLKTRKPKTQNRLKRMAQRT